MVYFFHVYIYILAEIPVIDLVRKNLQKLYSNSWKLLLPYYQMFWSRIATSSYFYASAKKLWYSLIYYWIQSSLILKKFLNNHIDYKCISILVTQKKEMPVLCKWGASFKLDRIMVAYKLLIFYLNILVYKLKQPLYRLQL